MKRNLLLISTAIVLFLTVALASAVFMGVFSTEKKSAALLQQGLASLDEGQTGQARETLLRAANKAGDHPALLIQIADGLKETDPERAYELLTRAMEAGGGEVADMRRAVRVYMDLEKFKEAGELLNPIREIEPNHPETLTLIGIIAQLDGHFEVAGLLYEQAYQQNYRGPLLLSSYGQLLSMSESLVERTRAKEMLQEAGQSPTRPGMIALLHMLTFPKMAMFAEDYQVATRLFREHPLSRSQMVLSNASLLRRLIDRFVRMDPDLAIDIAQQLIEHPEHRPMDLVGYILLTQRSGQHEKAAPVLQQALKNHQEDIAFEILSALQLMLRNQTATGMQNLHNLQKREPNHPVLLAVLETIARKKDMGLSGSEKVEVLEMLVAHPQADLNLQVLALAELIQIRPLHRNAIIEQAGKVLMEKHPEVYAEWLITHGAAQTVVQIWTEADVMANPQLFTSYFTALMAINELDRATELLRSSGSLLPRALRETMEALLLTRSKDREQAIVMWDMAFEHASLDARADLLLMLARLATELVDAQRSLQAFRAASMKKGVLTSDDWNLYFNLALQLGSVREAARVASQLLQQDPDNVHYINNEVYLNLLLGQGLSNGVNRMESVLEKQPRTSNFRVTLALAHLLSGNREQALRVVEDTELDLSERGEDRAKAVYIAILYANNRTTIANNLLATVNRERLSDEEWQLMQRLRSEASR